MASTRKASIAAELRADRSKFKSDLAAAKGDVRAFGNDVRRAGGSLTLGGGLHRNFTEINSRATAARNVVQQVYDIAKAPAAANVWYGDLKDSLTAVMSSADAAKEHLSQLRLISDEMSLSDDQFEKMVEYSVRLQSMGKSAEFAAEFVREMANAGEGMGRGIEDMEASIMALDAIEQKGEASMKMLMALSKSVPAFRKVLEAGFGVQAAHDLEKLNLSAEELTQGILNGMKALATAKPSTAEEGLSIEQRKKQTLGADADDNEGELAKRVQLTAEELAAARRKQEEASAARRKTADDEKAEAGRAELEREEQILDAQKQLALAELRGNKEHVALWEDRIAIMEKAADLAKEHSISEKEAAAHLIKQNQIRRETAALAENTRTPEQASGMASTKEQIEIDRLRSRGKNKEADKRQRALDVAGDTERFKAEGFNAPGEAEAMAEQSAQTKEDQAYFERTGRRKIKGGKSKNLKPGIDGEFHSERYDFAGFQDESIDYDFRQKKNQGGKSAPAAEQKGATDSKTMDVFRDLKDALTQKLDQLIAVTTGTAGDRIQPSATR